MLMPYRPQGRTPRPSKCVTLRGLHFGPPPTAPVTPAPVAGQTPTEQPKEQEKAEVSSQTSEASEL